MSNNAIDIHENEIWQRDPQLLVELLRDRTTGKNIFWATKGYELRGDAYQYSAEITVASITGENGNVIQPRVSKSLEEQRYRVRSKAEVFTPAWLCNAQNNLIDAQWFGRDNVFNREVQGGWVTNTNPIEFGDIPGTRWQDYVLDTRLEIACGEGPYLASRYDAATGKVIPVEERIGLLDRKLRVVSENCPIRSHWLNWAHKAVQSVYGYEWQGDNLLLARESLLYTFIDFYAAKFGRTPTKEDLRRVARTITWNIWQMDGLKGVVPDSCKPIKGVSSFADFMDFVDEEHPCPGCIKGCLTEHTGTYCLIRDWAKQKTLKFISMIGG